jgi:succinate dehydrogenase flavin-adding protein (antitoxin of CptAB toxin-antitoxin module)
MSQKISNLFASRAFSEHPLALWALDDEMSFVSLLSQNNKDILTWTGYNEQEAVGVNNAPNTPLVDEISSIVIPITASPQYMDFLGPNINLI